MLLRCFRLSREIKRYFRHSIRPCWGHSSRRRQLKAFMFQTECGASWLFDIPPYSYLLTYLHSSLAHLVIARHSDGRRHIIRERAIACSVRLLTSLLRNWTVWRWFRSGWQLYTCTNMSRGFWDTPDNVVACTGPRAHAVEHSLNFLPMF